ncbi:MAG TPA: right-handed parallel beta-helix repeat-containing protein [Verrucomicrobiae bacterium]|jgi:parallel beta-helix repeat protein
MKTKGRNQKSRHRAIVTLAFVLSSFIFTTFYVASPSSFGQGALTPPGAPAPLFKTLQQVEPRTPVASAPFTITNPGSYYLTTNLTPGSGMNGIIIQTNNVTLDLSGFSLIGAGGASTGIVVSAGRANIAIFNGTITGWNQAVGAGFSVNCHLKDLQAFGNIVGILSGTNGVVENCVVSGSTGTGFSIGAGGLARHCFAFTNGTFGFTVNVGTVLACTARLNGSNGIDGAGMLVADCNVFNNGGQGINDSGTSIIRGCRVEDNALDGIRVGVGTLVAGNNCNGTTNGSGRALIRATGSRNRIEDNHVTQGDNGIVVGATNNLIIRNSAFRNTVNYVITTGNMVGPTNSVGGVVTNHPWANFSF